MTDQRGGGRRPHGSHPRYDLSPTGIVCPRCRRGEIVPVRVAYGLAFACSRSPVCGVVLRARPTGRTCPYVRASGQPCGGLMVEGTRRIPERCSDTTCPNHFPHLLPPRPGARNDR